MESSRDVTFKRAVGILAITTIAAALYALRVHNRESGMFMPTFVVYATVERADGIKVDTPVTLAGIPVGRVSGFRIQDDNTIRLSLELDADYRERVRKDSVATVSRPILGSASVDITLGTRDAAPLGNGETIQLARRADLGDVVAALSEKLAEVDTILKDFRHVAEQVAKPDGPLFGTLADMRRVSAGLEKFVGEKGSIPMRFEAAAASMEQAMQKLQQILATVDRSADAMPGLAEQARQILDNLQAVSATLRDMRSELPELAGAARATLQDADDVLHAAKKSVLLRSNLPALDSDVLVDVPRAPAANLAR